jgi:hypothetical protein
MPSSRQGYMSDELLPAPFEGDDDFFPEQEPEEHSSRFSWRRDREAARLKAVGHDLEEIAQLLQLNDPQTGEPDARRAAKAIQRGLTAVYRFTTDEMRLQELQSLDEMERHLWECLRREHVLVQQGRVIMIEGQVIQDERFVLECLDRILKIKERRSKYLGLDAQVRLSVEADQIGGEIAQLIAMINATEDATREVIGVPEVEQTAPSADT